MNQILNTEQIVRKKKKEKGIIEIEKIVMFFAIALILFGIFSIGTASYAMYKNAKEEASKPVKPVIQLEQTNKKELKLSVTCKQTINAVYYSWNNEAEEKISGNNRTEIENTLSIPAGENVLKVRAVTTAGTEEKIEQTYQRNAIINIQLSKQDPNIVVKLEGKNKIEYMTYRWNREQEQKVEVNSTSGEYSIKAISGENTLTITAVDETGETETIKKVVKGVDDAAEEESDKPKLIVTTDGKDNFVIVATDAAGLQKVQFILNETEKYELNLDGRTELNYKYPFSEGNVCKLEVNVYNVKGAQTTFKAMIDKSKIKNN